MRDTPKTSRLASWSPKRLRTAACTPEVGTNHKKDGAFGLVHMSWPSQRNTQSHTQHTHSFTLSLSPSLTLIHMHTLSLSHSHTPMRTQMHVHNHLEDAQHERVRTPRGVREHNVGQIIRNLDHGTTVGRVCQKIFHLLSGHARGVWAEGGVHHQIDCRIVHH